MLQTIHNFEDASFRDGEESAYQGKLIALFGDIEGPTMLGSDATENFVIFLSRMSRKVSPKLQFE